MRGYVDYMMSEGQELAVEIGAAVIGTAQPFLLRTYADTTYGTLIPQIGAYGTPSCLAGIVAGGAATIAGIASLLYGKGIQDRALAKIALSYGVPAGEVPGGIFAPEGSCIRCPGSNHCSSP